jgi:uncharacterized membrane protein YqhA
MLTALFGIRYVTILAVIAALFGALLMILTGSSETIQAWQIFLGLKEAHLVGGPNVEATVKLLSALDQFLFGLVLLYVAYSIYFLYIKREAEDEGAARIRMPEWLQVQSLAQMKKPLLEVIVVLITVLFLKIGLETQAKLGWEMLVMPFGIVAIAVAIKLIGFEH